MARARGVAGLASTVLLVLHLCVITQLALAAGIAVSPGELEIRDAFRGAEYDNTVTIFNPDDDASSYAISTEGDAAAWISFYDPDSPTSAIEKVSIPANSKVRVLVRFRIPQDAANGGHAATIVVTTVPLEGEGGSGQAVSLAAPVAVTITVTGTQIVSGSVDNISLTDVEVKYPLRLGVMFLNSGNVVAAPQVDIEIADSEGNRVDSFSSNSAKVKPGSRQSIPVEWDTTGIPPGAYSASVTVSLGQDVITKKELRFAVLETGTLTRAGAAGQPQLKGKPQVGNVTILQTVFTNTGEIDTKAKFVGEMYLNDRLVDVLQSEELLVQAGSAGTLETYVRADIAGKYEIRGHVNYEGKRTEATSIFFTVGGAIPQTGGNNPLASLSPLVIGSIFVLAVALMGGIYLMVRQRRGTRLA